MLTLTEESANSINFEEKSAIMEALQDIAYNSGTQANLSANLAVLKSAAEEHGKSAEFAGSFQAVLQADSSDPYFQETGLVIRLPYTLDDFQYSEAPYLEVFTQPSEFLRQRALEAMAMEAQRAKFKGFKKLYKAFLGTVRQVSEHREAGKLSVTDFPNQPMELDAGDWICDYSGVRRVGSMFEEVACLHPIMPVERLVNIDTGEEKLKIAYYKGRYWREAIYGKDELFDASKVIKLSKIGVSVTTKTARALSEYLCGIEGLNYDDIPESESVSRLGFVDDGKKFSPYVDGIIFDGEANFSASYNAVAVHKGSFEDWLETALRCRADSLTAKIMLAASFASVLINKIGALCFFVHLWGVESGTGKTVALMLAASVWGNPEIGAGYVQTFNATEVNHERVAGFLNNVPMCIDELQLSKDSHGHSKFSVYRITQGVGRGRGTKTGGIDDTLRWSLCALTTGESPIAAEGCGSGEVNRVIDIECRANNSVIKDGIGVCRVIKQNYGHAGEIFVNALTDGVIKEVREDYENTFKMLCGSGETTEKQAMAAAMIIIADKYADRFIFKTGSCLTVSEMSEFLKEKSSISAGQRGYDYMCNWVAMNANNFLRSENKDDSFTVGSLYGVIDEHENIAYINSAVFKKAAADAGFDSRALLSWLKTNELIRTRAKGFSKPKRIKGVITDCIAMLLSDELDTDESDYLDLVNGNY